jgi:hypothetical protein
MDNCYKLWTKKEEEVLIDLYTSKNLKIYEISNILKRTSGAIHARLEKMDLKRNISLKLENDIECILDELKQIHLLLNKIHNNKIYTEI